MSKRSGASALERLVARGIERFNRDRPAQAASDFTRAATLEPGRADLLYYRALCRERQGLAAQARRDAEQALARDPRSPARELLERLDGAAPSGARRDARRAEAELARLRRARGLEARGWKAAALEASVALSWGLTTRARRAAARLRRSPERSAERHLAAARLLRDLKDFQGAERECAAALELAGRRDEAVELYCQLQRELACGEGPLKALRRAEAAARLAPRSPEAWRACAELQAAGGLIASASASLRRAAALDPSLSLWAAQCWRKLGEFGRASVYVRRAARREPGLPRAWEELALLSLWLGRTRETARACGRWLRAGGSEAAARRARGAAAVLEGRLPEALAELDAAALLAPEGGVALVWRAEALRRSGRSAEALEALERAAAAGERGVAARLNRMLAQRALGQEPSGAELEAVYGLLPWRQLDAGAAAWPSSEAAERLLLLMRGNRGEPATFAWTPSDRDVHYDPRFHLMTLQAFLRFGDVERVLEEFRRIAAQRPRDGYPPASRGEACLWLGRYDEAQRDLELSLRLDPKAPWPNVGLCACKALRGDLAGARRHLELAERNRAAEPVMATWRGELLRLQGKPREALAALARARASFPFRPTLWLNVALAKGEAGDRRGQRELLRRLERHYPAYLAAAARGGGGPEAALRRALDMARGNRSSWMYTYVDRGRLRHAALAGVAPESAPAGLRNSPWIFSPI